ncbi:MAG: response regulator [Alphaproteobacteria bacterium]|nr:response regulator [Alphaproteobacteria bacterium]
MLFPGLYKKPSLPRRRIRCLAAILLPVVFIIALLHGFDAVAQITKSARVELLDLDWKIYLGKETYLTEDSERRLTSEIIAMRHDNNLRGKRQDSAVINIGAQTAPAWLAFSVINNSSHVNWVLDFGSFSEGRLGLIKKLALTNITTGEVYNWPPERGEKNSLLQDALPVKIHPGKSEFFVLSVEMEKGLFNTLAPSLIPYPAYIENLGKGNWAASAIHLFFIAVVTLFTFLAFLHKDRTYGIFTAYYAAYYLIFLLIEHGLFTRFFLAGESMLLLYAAGAILGIGITKAFLNINPDDFAENTLLFSMASLVAVSVLLNLTIFPGNTIADSLLVLLPGLLAALSAGFVSYAQGRNGKPAGLFLAAGWIIVFFGMLITLLAHMGAIPVHAFSMSTWLLFLLPQAGFFLAASTRKTEMLEAQERQMVTRENRAAQSLARLKQSKESADQARLLRVIERERELMAELREREMQRAEEMRKAKEMADQANQAKSAFLAVVGHEIRTPMTGIMGIVRLMNDTKLSKEQQDYILAVQKSGDTMIALLNDILDFEKIETQKMELEHIDFDLPKLVHGVVTLMSGHAATKNVALGHNIGPDFPRYVKGDPTRLRQVLLNLVSNALKFTESGSVTITLNAAHAKNKIGIHEIYFAVTDTGIGIPPEVQEKLFKPFEQADKTIARKYGGSGLGLAICQRLIEAMGGAIAVSSEIGKGSTFHFTLAMATGDAKTAETLENPGGRTGAARVTTPPLRILIIEDNEINRKVLQNFLARDGHRVSVSNSAENAINLVEMDKFDVIFSDINLTGMSGIEAVKIIRAMPDKTKAATPVIAITGNTAEEDIRELRQAGMNDYLAKPIDFDRLQSMLADVHAGRYATRTIIKIPALQKKQEAAQQAPAQPAPPPPAEPEEAEIKSRQGNYQPKFPHPEEHAPIQAFLKDLASGKGNTKRGGTMRSVKGAPIDPNIFDQGMMQGLLDALGKAQIADLMNGFVQKADEIVAALQQESSEENLTAIRERAHELKGMAANFGIKELSAIAKKIEDAAQEAKKDIAVAEIEKLPQANDRAKEAIKDWLG